MVGAVGFENRERPVPFGLVIDKGQGIAGGERDSVLRGLLKFGRSYFREFRDPFLDIDAIRIIPGGL